MPLALITTDKRWYHVDVYSARGTVRVKVAQKSFEATPDDATEVFLGVARQYPSDMIVKFVWDPGGKRWQRMAT